MEQMKGSTKYIINERSARAFVNIYDTLQNAWNVICVKWKISGKPKEQQDEEEEKHNLKRN